MKTMRTIRTIKRNIERINTKIEVKKKEIELLESDIQKIETIGAQAVVANMIEAKLINIEHLEWEKKINT